MFQSGKKYLSPPVSDRKLLNITLIDENIFCSIPSDMLSGDLILRGRILDLSRLCFICGEKAKLDLKASASPPPKMYFPSWIKVVSFYA